MEYQEFIGLVARMRKSQKRYFERREVQDMIESKRLEKEVDQAIATITAPTQQLSLEVMNDG